MSKTNWLSSQSRCGWYGVTCNENGFVQGIDLAKNELSGKLPPEIGLFQPRSDYQRKLQVAGNETEDVAIVTMGLTHFDISENFVRSTIPTEIEHLTNMEEFYINSNQLTGPIPSGIFQWQNLSSANFSGNNLQGDVSLLCSAGLESLSVDCGSVLCECCTPICTATPTQIPTLAPTTVTRAPHIPTRVPSPRPSPVPFTPPPFNRSAFSCL